MYWIYRLLHLLRYIAKYVYVRGSMLNKRCVTLPTVNWRPCASEVFKTAILKDFEFAVYCLLLSIHDVD